jgi:4'-phosphopantetheinyl transferase
LPHFVYTVSLVSVMTAEGIEVLVSRLDLPAGRGEALLSCDERKRAARLRSQRDRRRFIAARACLRELLGRRLDIPAAALEIRRGPRGKPQLAGSDWRFSVSHSDDVAIYAFARGREVGIDLEAVRAVPEASAIAGHAFADAKAFLRWWTRKEALFKALGCPQSMSLEEIDVDSFSAWHVVNFRPLPGFVAALACEAP